jgi:putative ABC transport system permease protein
MDDLLDTVFTVRGYAMMALAIVAAATLATMTLVFALSVQLRRRELETMNRIGGTIARIRGIVAVEIISVLGVGVLLAAVASALTGWFAMTIIHAFLVLR